MAKVNNNVETCRGASLKNQILLRTHYGTNIYAHILRECYPEDEVVMHIHGRDCGLCRNPFAKGGRTLHIYIAKSNPDDATSAEYARHTATDNSIPDGDAFSFAELHYHQSGEKLLATLNKELSLHIGEQVNWFGSSNVVKAKSTDNGMKHFSFFSAPITNTLPKTFFNLVDTYKYIIGDQAKERTIKYRAMLGDANRTKGEARMFKASNFDYCTFSGIFTSRSDKALIRHSSLMCLDFDHLKDVDSLRSQLLQDEYFETQLLFRSPSGDGLKWIVEIDISKTQHADYFRAIANYIQSTYGVEVDKSGKDISRACFLPYDPHCYINKTLLK